MMRVTRGGMSSLVSGFLLVAICGLSTSNAFAQRRAVLGQPAVGSGRNVIVIQAPPARPPAGIRGQIIRDPLGRQRFISPKLPLASPLSISRPIGNNISSVQPNPSLGFGLRHVSPFFAPPGTYQQLTPYSYPFEYGYPLTAYGSGYAPGAGEQQAEPEMVNGLLALDVSPASASVFIDNAYVGTAADLANGITLGRGRHWLEIEAPQYDRKLTEILITPGQTLRYSFDLSAARPAPVVTAPRGPQTIYTIPGCYGGNRPPVAGNLPPGCDIAKVRVIRPPGQN